MEKESFIVAEAAGVPIHAHEGIKSVSFTNSPYYAHMHLGAIDLYPREPDGVVLSPVKGHVTGVREVKAPRPKYFEPREEEKLLLIANNSESVTKILHLGPTVSVGDLVEVSDPIGEYVKSGFFNSWTSESF